MHMKVHKQKHNPAVVKAFFASYGIPEPQFEYAFHPKRKWRFDMAWPVEAAPSGKDGAQLDGLYLEVQGGIWGMGRPCPVCKQRKSFGGHNRGAQMKKDWEKYNEATALGWRPIFVEPGDLLKKETSELIRRALCLT